MIEKNEYYYNWLEDATPLDIHIGSMNDEVKAATDFLFKEVSNIFESKRAKARTKEMLKLILLNLWIADRQNMPVKYSRNRNHYTSHKRYGKLFFKYDRTIGIIDALEELGYIQQRIGYLDREHKVGRQTRMYAVQKLKDLFQGYNITEPGFIEKTEPDELVVLKNEKILPPKEGKRKPTKEKNKIDYTESDETRSMRANLMDYNAFIKSQDIQVSLDSQTELDARFLNKLRLYTNKGIVEPCSLTVAYRVITEDNSGIGDISNVCMTTPQYSCPIETDILSNDISTITKRITESSGSQTILIQYNNKTAIQFLELHIHTITKRIRDIENEDERNEEWKRKRTLRAFGLESLTFKIHYESLHRVFNKESFECGGRFYGACHLSIPSSIRKRMIQINGEPTVEFDFKALHIRMLYHDKGIDYREDPYGILCESEEERKMYKLAQLIAINAEDEKSATDGIRDVFRRKGIRHSLKNDDIRILLDRFKKAHMPIAEYINTGKGLTLQNLDSAITEDILISFMREGIPCLPVHDSYIVLARYKDRLYQKMMEAYEKVMGFEPVID